MRQLWRAACGRIDLDVMARAFWVGAFTEREIGDAELADMHPLRKLERPPPPEKTPEQKKQESKLGWRMIRKAFKQRKGR